MAALGAGDKKEAPAQLVVAQELSWSGPTTGDYSLTTYLATARL